jgi:hypothetical protein
VRRVILLILSHGIAAPEAQIRILKARLGQADLALPRPLSCGLGCVARVGTTCPNISFRLQLSPGLQIRPDGLSLLLPEGIS